MAAATDNTRAAIRAMNQKAIWWASDDHDEFGKPSYATPVEIDCRWEDEREEFINANGDQIISNSKLIVDRDMNEKDRLKLGELDSTVDNDPYVETGTWEVLRFAAHPDTKGVKYTREVWL